MAMAMGKSKLGPNFFKSAGAKLTVILVLGNNRSEFLIALLTLSLASETAISGRPTIKKLGLEADISASTSIKWLFKPMLVAENILEGIELNFFKK